MQAVQHIYDYLSINVNKERFSKIADSDVDSEDYITNNVASTNLEEGLSASRKRKQPR